MDVSIIFVNYKTKDITINAIKSVIEKTEGLQYEIFVVDNNSQDGSIEAIEKEFPNVIIIKNPINAGFGAANNIAIKQAKGKYVFCLNTDTILINNAIKIMFDFMEQHSDAGCCGGRLYNRDNNLVERLYEFPKMFDFKTYYKGEVYKGDAITETGWISGADMFMRKSVLDKIGLFDENFFMYCEEIDLCKRIREYNYKIFFIPQAEITHLESASTDVSTTNFPRVKYLAHSVYYYYKKHFGIFSVLIPRFYYLYKYFKNFIKYKKFSELKALIIAQLA